MANPQLEKGYTPIPNQLLEALARIRIPGEARQVLDVIIRKTYGFHKDEDAISLSQFLSSTNLLKPHICDSIKKLRQMNLITENENNVAKMYGINRDFRKWIPLPKKVTLPKKVKPFTENGKESLPNSVTTKERKIKKTFTSDSEEVRLSEFLLTTILARLPTFKKPDIQNWARHIDLMLRADGRTVSGIENAIKWCQQDSFWQHNILSTKKLRDQYDTLVSRMNGGIPRTQKLELTPPRMQLI